jgi:hypothetical protein
MPNHGVATHIASDDQANHRKRQGPVKKTRGEIPNSDSRHSNTFSRKRGTALILKT